MLDQNTDRMWFVIGAVIVGAAIIFIANGTIPDIFASVAESFQDSSDKATAVVDEMYVYGVLPDGLRAYRGAELEFAQYPEILQISTGSNNDGVYFDTSRYASNSTYELTFEFEKVDGEMVHMAGHSQHFWVDSTYYLDGAEQGLWHNSYRTSIQDIDDFERHSVRVVFHTGEDVSRTAAGLEENNHLHIQPNRGIGNPPVTVNIYNLKLEKIE